MKNLNLLTKLKNLKTKLKPMETTKEEALASLQRIEEEQKRLRKVIEGFDSVKSIKDVKNFEDILEIAKSKGYKFRDKQEDEEEHEFVYRKLILICKVLNEGHFFKRGENRWYPYFSLSCGFDFVGSGYAFGRVDADGGFRLCFKTKEISDFAGKTFTQEFRDFLTND